MKKEYDFSKGVRGKFYSPDMKLNIPVYLDDDVRDFITHIAEIKQRDFTEIVNELLRTDMMLAKAMQ